MRIILLLPSDHIYANFIAKELLRKQKNKVILIAESNILMPNSSFYHGIRKYLFISGFRCLAAQTVKQYLFKIRRTMISYFKPGDIDNLQYSYKEIAKRYKIPIKTINKINNEETAGLFDKLKPDLIISVFFRQILKKKILSMPKLGCLNLHPAKLPYYRGVSPIFWALAKGENTIGVTLHFLDEKIDLGDIISQETVAVSPKDTEHSLYIKCSIIGLKLLLEAINRIENGISIKSHAQKENEGTYFSVPTKEMVKEFKRRGRSFFKFKELI